MADAGLCKIGNFIKWQLIRLHPYHPWHAYEKETANAIGCFLHNQADASQGWAFAIK